MKRREALLYAAASTLAPGAMAAQPAEANARVVRVAVFRQPVYVAPTVETFVPTRTRNAEAMVAAIERVMSEVSPKPRLLVFPVLQYTSSARASASGVPIEATAIDLVSKPLSESIYAPVVAACRRHDCYVATSTHEKNAKLAGKYHHTGIVIGPEGLVLRSPKAQAYSAADITSLRDIADDYAKAYGEEAILPVARTPIGVIGCFVESEVEVTEAGRLLASKGAEIIVHPSGEDERAPWMALKQSMAFQCGVYLATGVVARQITAANPNGKMFPGAATIIGPDGKVIAFVEAPKEGYVIGDLDLDAVTKRRNAARGGPAPARRLYRHLYSD